MAENLNPLKQFFRQPAIYLKLPSAGQYWPPGSLEMPPNNEIPILPMTAIDEITYRTPDALFNGSAVANVIQSCCPSIKNAWKAPNIDINALLVAIRIASYGDKMEIETTCPACTTVAEYSMNLNIVLDSMKPGNFNSTVKRGDLEIYFRPIDYEHQNKMNALQFEQQRIMQTIPNDDSMPEEEKLKQLSLALQAITRITVEAIKSSVAGIRTPQALVSEPEFIEEFLLNCDRTLFNEIRDKAIELRAASELKPMDIACNECGHQYEQPLTLDSTNFFAVAS